MENISLYLKKKNYVNYMFKKLIYHDLYPIWKTWQMYVLNQQIIDLSSHLTQQKLISYKALVTKWKYKLVKPCFQKWFLYQQYMKQYRSRLILMTLKRLYKSSQWLIYRQWKLYIEQHKINQIKQQYQLEKSKLQQKIKHSQQYIAKNMLKKVSHIQYVKYFNQLKSYSQYNQAKKIKIITNSLNHIKNNKLWLSWRLWLHYIEDKVMIQLKDQFLYEKNVLNQQLIQQKERSATYIIQKLKAQQLTKAFRSLKSYTINRLNYKTLLMSSIFQRITNQKLWICYRHWKLYIDTIAVRIANDKWQAYEMKNKLLTTQLQQSKQQIARNLIQKNGDYHHK